MKFLIVILLFFTLLNAEGENHHFYSKDLTYLHLSQTQSKQMKKVLKEYRKSRKIYRKQKEKISKLKQKEFLNEKFDVEKLKRLDAKISTLTAVTEIKFLQQIHKILSKKQRKKFALYMDEWDSE